MINSTTRIWIVLVTALVVGLLSDDRVGAIAPARQEATPTVYSCDRVPAAATPTAMTPPMDMSSPMAGMDMEFDQNYIDMMIPHHASIVALAEAALPKLTDTRLKEIAENIISAQTAEQEELRGYREAWYGSPDPMPMDPTMMMDMMPGMDMSPDEMAMQMDPAAQVAAFCAAADPDLAFIDLVIPHHEMAIASSRAALEQATNDELRAFAQRVIEDQQMEIDELSGIRMDLAGSATPES